MKEEYSVAMSNNAATPIPRFLSKSVDIAIHSSIMTQEYETYL